MGKTCVSSCMGVLRASPGILKCISVGLGPALCPGAFGGVCMAALCHTTVNKLAESAIR